MQGEQRSTAIMIVNRSMVLNTINNTTLILIISQNTYVSWSQRMARNIFWPFQMAFREAGASIAKCILWDIHLEVKQSGISSIYLRLTTLRTHTRVNAPTSAIALEEERLATINRAPQVLLLMASLTGVTGSRLSQASMVC